MDGSDKSKRYDPSGLHAVVTPLLSIMFYSFTCSSVFFFPPFKWRKGETSCNYSAALLDIRASVGRRKKNRRETEWHHFRLTFAILWDDIGRQLFGPSPGGHPLFLIVIFVVDSPGTLKSPQKQEPLQRGHHGFLEREKDRRGGWRPRRALAILIPSGGKKKQKKKHLCTLTAQALTSVWAQDSGIKHA